MQNILLENCPLFSLSLHSLHSPLALSDRSAEVSRIEVSSRDDSMRRGIKKRKERRVHKLYLFHPLIIIFLFVSQEELSPDPLHLIHYVIRSWISFCYQMIGASEKKLFKYFLLFFVLRREEENQIEELFITWSAEVLFGGEDLRDLTGTRVMEEEYQEMIWRKKQYSILKNVSLPLLLIPLSVSSWNTYFLVFR